MSLSDNTHPDGRTYLAISNAGTWQTGLDPVSAASAAFARTGMDRCRVYVYSVVAENFFVDMFGSINTKDIRNGVPIPVGAYEAVFADEDTFPVDDAQEEAFFEGDYERPVLVTPELQPAAELWFAAEWKANASAQARAEKLQASA